MILDDVVQVCTIVSCSRDSGPVIPSARDCSHQSHLHLHLHLHLAEMEISLFPWAYNCPVTARNEIQSCWLAGWLMDRALASFSHSHDSFFTVTPLGAWRGLTSQRLPLASPRCIPDDMLPFHGPCRMNSTFHTTRRTRRWISLLAVLLSGIFVLHLFAPDGWTEAIENIRNVQGPTLPLWPARRPPSIWDQRAQRVKDAFINAYGYYQKYAFGADEVAPLSHKPKDKYVQIAPWPV